MNKDTKSAGPIFAAKNVTVEPSVTSEAAQTYLLCADMQPTFVGVLQSQLGVRVVENREAVGFVGEVVVLDTNDKEWFVMNRPGMTMTCLNGTVAVLSELYARYGREIPALFVSMPLIVTELVKGDDDGDRRTATSAD